MDKTVASDATDSGSTPDGCTIKSGAHCAPPFMAKVRKGVEPDSRQRRRSEQCEQNYIIRTFAQTKFACDRKVAKTSVDARRVYQKRNRFCLIAKAVSFLCLRP